MSVPLEDASNHTLWNMNYISDILKQPCEELLIQNQAGFCVPNCMNSKWSLYDASIHQTEDAFLALAFAVGIISGLIVLITWMFVRKMWKFPVILPFYMNMSASLSAFFLGLTFVMGRPQSFCSSKELTVALQSTTTLCNVQGTLVHFFSQAAILWWMFTTFNLFVVICRPLSNIAGHILLDNTRLHIIECLLSSGIPLILVIIVHGVDQYYPTLGPDTIGCTPRSQSLHYFTQALPIQLSLGAGLTFLIQVVFTVKNHRKRQTRRQKSIQATEAMSSNHTSVDKGRLASSHHSSHHSSLPKSRRKSLENIEKRFVFIFITYPICLVAILLTIIIQLEDVENFENSFKHYFLCVGLHLPNDICHSYLRYTHPELSLCALLAFIAYCVFALFFSLTAKPIRKFWYKQWKKLSCEKGEYVAQDEDKWCPNPIGDDGNGGKAVQTKKETALSGQHKTVQFEENEKVISNSKFNSSRKISHYESSV
jgi:hypothetical protein